MIKCYYPVKSFAKEWFSCILGGKKINTIYNFLFTLFVLENLCFEKSTHTSSFFPLRNFLYEYNRRSNLFPKSVRNFWLLLHFPYQVHWHPRAKGVFSLLVSFLAEANFYHHVLKLYSFRIVKDIFIFYTSLTLLKGPEETHDSDCNQQPWWCNLQPSTSCKNSFAPNFAEILLHLTWHIDF